VHRQTGGYCSLRNVCVPGTSVLESASLSYIRHFTFVTCYSTHVIFLVFVWCLWFCTVLYCVCAFECNIYVGVFEEIDEFSNLWTMVCKGCPFFVFIFILFLVDFLLHLCFQVCYEFLQETVVSCHGLYCFPFRMLSFYC